MNKKNKKNGFTLVEIIVSLFVISLVMITAISIFYPTLSSSGNTEEYIKLTLLLKEKTEFLQGLGYWVWDVDTQNPRFPNNEYDPAIVWKNNLAEAGFTKRATIETTFLKNVDNELVAFSGSEFDGNVPRNIIKITVSLYPSEEHPLSQTIMLYAYPSKQKVIGVMATIQRALNLYKEETSSYPASNRLDLLIPTYLAEIPNDPYTTEKEKITNTEEITDWYYDNTAGEITLSPNSHRLQSEFTITFPPI